MSNLKEDELVIQKIFKDLVPSFGLNHARIFHTLLQSGEAKTAKQLINETKVKSAKTYKTLAELVNWKMLRESNTFPALFYIESPLKIIDRLIKSRLELLEQKKLELKKLLANGDENITEEYLIKIVGKQTKLINNKTKQTIEDEYEVRVVKRLLEKVKVRREQKYCSRGYNIKELVAP